jgi:hypothetical protein
MDKTVSWTFNTAHRYPPGEKTHAASALSESTSAALRIDDIDLALGDDSGTAFARDGFQQRQGQVQGQCRGQGQSIPGVSAMSRIESLSSSDSSNSSGSSDENDPVVVNNAATSTPTSVSALKSTFMDNMMNLKNRFMPDEKDRDQNSQTHLLTHTHTHTHTPTLTHSNISSPLLDPRHLLPNMPNPHVPSLCEEFLQIHNFQDIDPPKQTHTNIPPPQGSTTKVADGSASSPNIFKKIMSRKALLPRMKAFKRISDEMQIESCPLYDEMQHEMIITTAMKEEDEILNSTSSYSLLLQRKNNAQYMLNYDNLKKFEIINKANESWNNHKTRRKSSSSITNSESFRSLSRRGSFTNLNAPQHNLLKRKSSASSLTPSDTNTFTVTAAARDDESRTSSNNLNTKRSQLLTVPLLPHGISRKRKWNYDTTTEFSTDVEADADVDVDYLSDDTGSNSWNPMINNKRRLVSASTTNSPKSPALDPFPSRRNSILMQSLQTANDEFEHMSLSK